VAFVSSKVDMSSSKLLWSDLKKAGGLWGKVNFENDQTAWQQEYPAC